MKAIGIYGAGDFVSRVMKNIDYIGVDGGIDALLRLNIIPKYIVGDFDSYEGKLPENINTTILPHVKDDTDTEVAIQQAIQLGYDTIYLYGVTGGRLDHFFAIVRTLVKYKDVHIEIIDDQNRIVLLQKGIHYIPKNEYTYLSFFALNTVHLSLSGVYYPLTQYELTYDNPLCVSNEITKETAVVECDEMMFMIQAGVNPCA